MAGRKKYAAILCRLIIALGAGYPAWAQTPVYPDTEDGFRAQMSAALDAYQKGDAAAGRSLLEQFRLPHAVDWFAQNFGPGPGEPLAKRYERLSTSYVNFTERNLEQLASIKGHKLTMHLSPATQEQPQIDPVAAPRKLSGIVPVNQPVCFNAFFSIKLTGKTELVVTGVFKFETWEDTFVY